MTWGWAGTSRRPRRRGAGRPGVPAVGREPADPFLVHAREVLRVAEDERGVDDLLHRAARGLEDGLDVPEALARLLLDRRPDDGTGGRVERPPAGHEHEPGRLHHLAVRAGSRPSEVLP